MSMQDRPTQPLTESTAGAHDGAHSGRSGSDQRNLQVRFNGAQRLVLWSASALIVLIGVFFVTDAVLRQVAQNVVREQIQNELPADVTAKDLSVKIDGFSVIAQFMAGRFDKVELSSSDVRIQGNPLTARVVAHGIPLDFNKPVQRVEGTMRISQDAVNNQQRKDSSSKDDKSKDNGTLEISLAELVPFQSLISSYQKDNPKKDSSTNSGTNQNDQASSAGTTQLPFTPLFSQPGMSSLPTSPLGGLGSGGGMPAAPGTGLLPTPGAGLPGLPTP